MPFVFRTLSAGVAAVALMSSAYAQGSPKATPTTPAEVNNALRNQEVTEREHADYSARGADIGGFKLFPTLDLTEKYTSNLYFEQSTHRADMITTISPGLRLVSDWNVHELELNVGSDILRHRYYSGEDVENFDVSASGRLDVTQELALRGRLSHELSHEARSSPDNAGGVSPTETTTQGALLGLDYKGPRIRLRTEAEATQYDFASVRRANGTFVNGATRNRTVSELRQRVGYEIIPEYVAFVEGIYNDRNYDTLDANGANRDSSGWEARVGTEIELSGALRGEVYASYMQQNYESSTFKTVSAPGAGVELTWTPTGLTTFTGKLGRTINETTTQNSGGSTSTNLELSAAHELRRNIILKVDATLGKSAYNETGRHETSTGGGFTGTYKLNRYLFTEANYHVGRRDNNTSTGEYLEHSALIKLGIQY